MARTLRKPTNLTIRTDLLEEARALGINLSQTLEAALAEELKKRREDAWRRENRAAIEAYNRELTEHGMWNERLRLF